MNNYLDYYHLYFCTVIVTIKLVGLLINIIKYIPISCYTGLILMFSMYAFMLRLRMCILSTSHVFVLSSTNRRIAI